MLKLIIALVLIALIGGQAAASDDYNTLLQLTDEFNQGLGAGDGSNTVIQGTSVSHLFRSPDNVDEASESRYTNIVYGMGPVDLALEYYSGMITDLENGNAQTGLSADFSGATSIGVYTENTLLNYNMDGITGTQDRSWESFALPLGTDARLDITSQRDLYDNTKDYLDAIRTEMRSVFMNDRAEYEFDRTFQGQSGWNIDTDRYKQSFSGFNWNMGFGYTDILAEDGLEYLGSMDVVRSSDYD